MTRPRLIPLLLLLLAAGCSLDVNGGLNRLSSQLSPECGWVTADLAPLEPVAEDRLCWHEAGSGCALVEVGKSACDAEPVVELPASGRPAIEVHKFGQDGGGCTTTLTACQSAER